MRGYPKRMATKQDFENILNDHPQWKNRALVDLAAIRDTEDDKVMQATTLKDEENPDLGYNEVEVDNPMPRYKALGFASRAEVSDVITQHEKIMEKVAAQQKKR